jgi:hypothetical protein
MGATAMWVVGVCALSKREYSRPSSKDAATRQAMVVMIATRSTRV